MSLSKLTKLFASSDYFHPLEVVNRCSETQLQVGENRLRGVSDSTFLMSILIQLMRHAVQWSSECG